MAGGLYVDPGERTDAASDLARAQRADPGLLARRPSRHPGPARDVLARPGPGRAGPSRLLQRLLLRPLPERGAPPAPAALADDQLRGARGGRTVRRRDRLALR